MSNLVAETIEDLSSADSMDIETLVNCAPKQWLNLNGTGTIAARDSFNSTSLTDLGTGAYQHNTINAFTDANYIFSGSTGGTTGVSGFAVRDLYVPRTASLNAASTFNSSAASLDAANVDILAIGDPA